MTDLTPTEDLMLETLAARHRLGEHLWTFESRHAPTARRLERKGLVNLMHGTVENTIRLSLTDAGKAAYLSDGYTAPIFRAECPAFYVGPRSGGYRADCTRKRHHRGRHRRRFETVELDDVTWLDDDGDAHGADPLNPAPRCPATYPVPGTTLEHRCDRREGHKSLAHRTDLTGEDTGDDFVWTDTVAAAARALSRRHADCTVTACVVDERDQCPWRRR